MKTIADHRREDQQRVHGSPIPGWLDWLKNGGIKPRSGSSCCGERDVLDHRYLRPHPERWLHWLKGVRQQPVQTHD